MTDFDIEQFTKPKSDQLNYDDLVGGDKLIKIREVKRHSEQNPVAVYFDGDNNKPWLPCKGMLRIIVAVWGSKAKDYAGKHIKLWGDPTVKYAGVEVGGIRIREMEGLTALRTMPLSVAKGKRAAYTVLPLKVEKQAAAPAAKPVLSHQEQIDTLLAAFDKIGVTYDMLELQQGCASVSFDIAALREIYSKITKDKMPISDFFKPADAAVEFE